MIYPDIKLRISIAVTALLVGGGSPELAAAQSLNSLADVPVQRGIRSLPY